MDRYIGVVGLGYVGLPVAVALAEKFPVIAYDKSETRVANLKSGIDSNNEVSRNELSQQNLTITHDEADLARANFYIVAVPTPIDSTNYPDLRLLEAASACVGRYLNHGDCVVYESTVYPGVTEDICVPVLEENSGLKGGADFKFGYSPERINPGDKKHAFTKIVKIVSGCDQPALEDIASVYNTVVIPGVYKAQSIKVAEAAKVIENTQRDINIALMNELSRIFSRMDIDTHDVLNAAATKWNFLHFKPGLVGGHCIGVDPYYLTHCARKYGYHPEVILSGRRVNDGMGREIAEQALLKLVEIRGTLSMPRVRVLGVTFKENCNDIRNSKVFDMVGRFKDFGCRVDVEDPLADKQHVLSIYNTHLSDSFLDNMAYRKNVDISQGAEQSGGAETLVRSKIAPMQYDSIQPADIIVLAVAHKEYCDLAISDFSSVLAEGGLIVDIKGILNKAECGSAGINLWRL